MELFVDKLFRASIDLRAVEFLVQSGKPAVFCINEENVSLDMPVIDDTKWDELCLPMIVGQDFEIFAKTGNVSFVHVVEYKGKQSTFRVEISGIKKRMISRRDSS